MENTDNQNSSSSQAAAPREPRARYSHAPVATGALEVPVEHNIERALKVLKRKLIKEGTFRELKTRRYYEKPSERKRRKQKESIKKSRKDAARARRNSAF